MAEISAKTVKDLRDQTGAGMMDCKRALSEADGDIKRATELLRERGLSKAGKREGRTTTEGAIALSIQGSAAGMVELGCETDFVARTDHFVELGDSLAAAIAADAGLTTPDALLAASVGGENVQERITASIAQLGENIVIKRVARLAIAGSGLVGGYVHAGGKLGVLVALEAGTGAESLEALAKDLAMHVAAADPSPVAIDRDGVSAELLDSERAIYRKQAEQDGKPEKVIDRIVDGKIAKFLSEIALVDQAFVKDPDKTVGDLIKDVGGEADARVVAFERFKLGEATAE